MQQLEFIVKGGGVLRGFDYEDIAYSLYDLSLAPCVDFETWMQDMTKRIDVQFGYNVRHDNPTNFVTDLIKYGLIMRCV